MKSPVTRLREHSFTVTYEDFVESVSAEFSSFVGHRVNSLILDDKSIPDLIGVSKDAQTYQVFIFCSCYVVFICLVLTINRNGNGSMDKRLAFLTMSS